jgi:S-(hydroxymethyl)glutathione dehydrogenase/alcohol dehydrogenase
VGVARGGDNTSLKTASVTFEKTLTGSYTARRSARDWADRATRRLKLDELITRTYKIDEAAQAFADLEAGRNARGVIVF